MTYYNGYPVTDSFLDCVNAVGGLAVMENIAVAANEPDERSEIAERAREAAGYGLARFRPSYPIR